MVKAEAEFAVAQSEEIEEHHAILDSIRDEAEVKANRRLIRQRQAEADAVVNELEAEIEAEEAVTEQQEGAELRQAAIYLPEGTENVDISDED
ncbi:hypothetical protein D1007_38989 [Hordeum vulgare]|nr:hypothetical protein D1007_38989 [Hordeum vulgare]